MPVNSRSLIIVLGLLSLLGPISIDMYLSSMPAMAETFNSTAGNVSLTLSSYFIGISVGQLVYGPLIDRYGSRRPLYAGLSLFVISSIGCAFSTSIEILISLRLLQALGACAAKVSSKAIVRQKFNEKDQVKVFSALFLIISISPLIAPILGTYISLTFGWRIIFVVLSIVGAVALTMIYWGLDDNKGRNNHLKFALGPILSTYLNLLKHPQFFTYSLTGAVATGSLYAYIAGSSHVFIKVYGLTELQYGIVFAMIASALAMSSQLNYFLIRRYDSETIIEVSILTQFLIGISLLVATYCEWIGVKGTAFLMLLFLSHQGLNYPNTSALSLRPFPNNAGSASALLGAIQMGAGGLISIAVSLLSSPSPLNLVIIMTSCTVLAFCILKLGKLLIRYRTNESLSDDM